MSLKSLMARLQSRAADAPDTRDTPCFADTRANAQIVPIDVAANDPEPDVLENLLKPVIAPEPSTNPNAWRELAQAYHLHHFVCSTCIAAGRGAMYGLRCGVGAALWRHYQSNE